jgi:Ca2+/Na+ antiporter
LIVFVVGNLIFSIVLHDGYVNYINLVSVVLAVIYIAFIMFSSTSLDRKIFAHYEKIETKTYSMCQKEDRFKSTYWTSNPATRLLIENDINTQEQINIKLD